MIKLSMNIPNLITFSRIAFIPIILVVYLYGNMAISYWLAALLFIIASITDWLDGYLARKLNQTSDYGAFLDPVADKLLVVCMLILLTSAHTELLLPTILIIAREIVVLALREWMAGQGERDKVAVAFSGKLKTTVQMIAISALLVSDTAPALLWYLGYWLLMLSAILGLWSMLRYFVKAGRA